MKKYSTLLISFFFISGLAFGKKVKFSVDMSGQIVNPLGVRVTGDFQTAAGFTGGDWSLVTLLTQETADTNIYSIIVDIPAFKKYEFKFVNGDQFYETEFVPIESRVGYNFNDNRWIYIDSLADDTTNIGAIRFAGNAPKDKKLARFYVDMQNESVSLNGIHVYGSFQGWNPTGTILYNFDSSTVYEVICYVDSLSSYEYRFVNGNVSSNEETIPLTCAINNNRGFTSVYDSLLATVCFSSCSACTNTMGIQNSIFSNSYLYPNPTKESAELKFGNTFLPCSITIQDGLGRLIFEEKKIMSESIRLEKRTLSPGLYFISIEDAIGNSKRIKWEIE